MSKLSVYISPPVITTDGSAFPWLNLTQYIEDMFSFSTGLPGGYIDASIIINLPGNLSDWWYQNLLGAHIEITEAGEIVWEGRVDNIGLNQKRAILNCSGYWSALTDIINYGFWSESRPGKWSVAEPALHSVATEADYASGRFDVLLENGISVKLVEGASINDFTAVIYTFTPDIVGGNTPKAAPREIHRIKGHIKTAQSLIALVDVRIKVTDQPFTDLSASWTTVKSWIASGAELDEDFDVNIAYGASPAPLAVMIEFKSNSNIVSNPNGYITLTLLQLRATRSDDDSGNITAQKILKTLIAGNSNLGFTTPEHLCLSTETVFIENPGLEILPFQVENMTVQEIATKLAEYSDTQTPPREWYPAIWGRRRLYFKPRSKGTVHWIISKKDLSDEGAEFERALETYWPEVYTQYKDDLDRVRWTTVKSDIKTRYGLQLLRRYQFPFDTTQGAVADVLRDAQFEFSKMPQQQADISISGYITNAVGALCPLWRVKAGDFIHIRDIQAGYRSADISDVTDPFRTFFIKETKYDYSSNKLVITPELPLNRLDMFAARLSDLV